jgi:two-component system sensor histidine kinase FlrB
MPVGVVILDVEGQVAFCNPKAYSLLGEPLLEQPWRSIIKRAFRPRLDDGHDMSLTDGRRVSVNTHALEGWPGQLLVLTDVTDTRRLQEESGRRERLSTLGKMSAYLAHQIRTPLAAALTYTTHLSSQSLPSAQHGRFMASLKARLFDIEGLIRELLVFATGGALTKERISIIDVICDARETLAPLIAESESCLALQLDPRCGLIPGNREALSTALQNLVNNAIQVKGGPTKVEISTHRVGSTGLEVHIMDDGPGVVASEREAIFQPFYTTRNLGSGLGLAVVRTVLEAHNGRAWVEPGEFGGSVFKLHLPMLPVEDSDTAPLVHATAAISVGG